MAARLIPTEATHHADNPEDDAAAFSLALCARSPEERRARLGLNGPRRLSRVRVHPQWLIAAGEPAVHAGAVVSWAACADLSPPAREGACSVRRGFTIAELLIVVAIIVLAVVVCLPAIVPRRHGCGNRSMKDATQVRGTTQAMIVWAGSNKGRYPLPSVLDAADATVAAGDDGPESKDNTGNILSILIYTGGISTDICINPAEANTGQVQMDGGYEFDRPSRAADPSKALWDPGFAGTPIDPASARRRTLGGAGGGGEEGGVANQSYAHMLPFGNRLALWRDTFSATVPIFGDRGPEYAGTTSPAGGRWTLRPGATGTGSNTLLIHGGRTSWEGNFAYNDAHVSFETKPDPDGVTYRRTGRAPLTVNDNLFVNETDEEGGDADGGIMRGVNAWLCPVACARRGAEGAVSATVWKD